jgi:hypothetical protein
MIKRTVFLGFNMVFMLALLFAGGQQQASGDGTQSSAVGVKQINGGRPVTLLIEGIDITENEVPTPEQPVVRVAMRKMGEKFMQLHPNITIKYDFTKPNDAGGVVEWYITRVAGGTCPIIGTSWNLFADRDWYYDLTQALDTPNEYISGNVQWKDQFLPQTLIRARDSKNRIIYVPYLMGLGAPTAIFVNKEIFTKMNLKYPSNYEELKSVVKALQAAGYVGLLPCPLTTIIEVQDWNSQFITDPPYVNALFDQLDYDKNGNIEGEERVRATKTGLFNPVTRDYARELLRIKKEIYRDIYPAGWQTMDFDAAWAQGKAGMKWDGTWNFPTEASNTKRNFDYDIIQVPLVDHNTSKFVKDIEYTEAGPDPNTIGGSGVNIMKPTADKDPGALEAAIAYLKYLCVPENLNSYLLENGTVASPIKGTVVPPLIKDWMSKPQPVFTSGERYFDQGFTTEGLPDMFRLFEQWVKDQINDDTFFRSWNDLAQKDADRWIANNGIDTARW